MILTSSNITSRVTSFQSVAALLARNPVNINIEKIQQIIKVPVLGDIGTSNIKLLLTDVRRLTLVPQLNTMGLSLNEARFTLTGDLLVSGCKCYCCLRSLNLQIELMLHALRSLNLM